MKIILISILIFSFSAFAVNNSEKEKLVKDMITSCKAELSEAPALSDIGDAEVVWKNLEDKEHASVKLSKVCHKAHEKYEHKYHSENEENESHE